MIDSPNTTLEAALVIWIDVSAQRLDIYMTDYEMLCLARAVIEQATLVLANEMFVLGRLTTR